MGLYVDKEYRVKRKSSEAGRKSAFAHKVKGGGKNYQRNVQERINRKGASKEVVVKISGGANTRQGIRNSIDYLTRESELPVMTEDGVVYEGKDINQAREHMIDSANDPQGISEARARAEKQLHQEQAKEIAQKFEESMNSTSSGLLDIGGDYEHEKKPKTKIKDIKITQNIIFSPPVSVKVKPEELLESVRATMQKKYPNNRFIIGYHDDKKSHPHVHVIFRIRDNDGKRTDIRKKDLREIRTGFCEELRLKGYDVKATHKQIHGLNEAINDANNNAPVRQKGVFEVVDVGYDHYQGDKANKKQHFITVKTLNKGVERTYWGADFGELCKRENVQKGDLVRLKKLGQKEVKIPALDKNGEQQGWKVTHRNDWKLENIGVKGVERNLTKNTNNEINTPEIINKQKQQMNQFNQIKQAMLVNEPKTKIGLHL